MNVLSGFGHVGRVGVEAVDDMAFRRPKRSRPLAVATAEVNDQTSLDAGISKSTGKKWAAPGRLRETTANSPYR